MELKCALILLVQISFVISSPYGYGPRAGASAKAEASAAAGALPVDIPQGGGYSGSFSKSYSSSSATSSASSSASSSSFSYNGSGSGGSPHGETGCGSGDCKLGIKGSTGSQGAYSGNNAASLSGQGTIGTGSYYNNDVTSGSHSEPKTSGCTSGNCQPTGERDSGFHGSTGSSNAYSGANAVASAGADLQSGSTYSKDNKNKPECEGSDCGSPSGIDRKCSSGQCGPNGNSDAVTDANVKCSSGNCGTSPQVGPPSVNYGTESKCTSGQCGPNIQPGSPSIDNNSNDIKVPTSTTGASNAKTNYGTHDQASAANSNSGCKYGNCGSQPASNPSYTPEYPPCSSPDCNNYGQGPSSIPDNQVYNKPSTLLTTPKEDTECTSLNCQTSHNKHPNVNSYPATNYGTPGQNSFTNPSTTSCIGGKCNYGQTKAPYSTTSVTNSLSPQQPSQITNSPSNCASGNCNLNPSTQGPAGYGGYSSNKPLYPYGSAAPHSPLPPSGPICVPGSLNCNTGALALPPGSSCLSGSPTCNDNVGSAMKPGPLLPLPPASICTGPTDVPCNDVFVAKPKPGPLTPFPSGPSCALGSPNCNAGPSIGYYDSNPKPGPLSPIPPHHNSRPSSPSHSFQPTSTAAFPPGPIGGSYSVTGSLPSSPHAVGYQPGLTGSGTYTSAPTSPSYNSPSNGLSSGQNDIATPAYNTPSGGCSAPNCAGSGIGPVVATAGANAQSKPIGASPSIDELPPYNGGFGGPSGILKPNEIQAQSSPYTPSMSSNTPSTSNPASCATGNCVQHLLTSPSYGTSSGSLATAGAGGFGGPAGVLKPNEFTVPSSNYNKPAISGTSENKPACSTGSCGQPNASPSYMHGISGTQARADASASANAVAYTGGFGGPPGVLKPFDAGKADPTPGKSQGGQYGPHQGSYSNNGVASHQGSYTNNGVGSHSNAGIQASSLAQANSVAGAASGTNGVGNYNNGGYGHKAGCGGGCDAPNSGSYGGAPRGGSYGGGSYGGNRSGANFGEGGLEGLHAAGASAKSQAGAIGGSGGYGGNYASSSATARAASGAAIKGSYGK